MKILTLILSCLTLMSMPAEQHEAENIGQDNGFTAKVKSEADYAPYQEYPTRYQPGTPHVRPGFFEQRIKFIQDMKRLMK